MAVRNPIEQILQKMRDVCQIDTAIVQLADSAFDLDAVEGRCFERAISRISGDLPLKIRKTVSNPTDEYVYLLEDIDPTWGPRHRITDIKWPIDDPSVETFIDRNLWRQTLDDATGKPCLRFLRGYPDSPFVVCLNAPHTYDTKAKTCTVSYDQEEAVVQMASHMVLEIAANKCRMYKNKAGEPFSNKIDWGEIVARYQEASDRCKKTYDELIDEDEEAMGPGFVDLDIDSPMGPFIFHPDTWR